MGKLENDLKKIILERYGSVKAFSEQIDIAYTTVDSILKRGIQKASVNNIIKICNALEISTDSLANGQIVPVLAKSSITLTVHNPENSKINVVELFSGESIVKDMMEDIMNKQQLEEFNRRLKETLPKDLGMPKKSTIAAHFDGEEFTEEELDEIRKFAEFVKSKRQE